jgi:transcriptional regulator with XRE-family HTH domain
MSVVENKFAVNLRILRKERKLTQEFISKLINVDRSNVANYENGRILPPLNSLIKIADYFGISLDQLIFGRDNKREQSADKELMAENTALMDAQLKFLEKIDALEKENKLLKQYNKALKEYNDFLENA